MKPINNELVIKSLDDLLRDDPVEYECMFCNHRQTGMIKYRETTYGVAVMYDLDGDYDDYETISTDDFTPYAYSCNNCGEERERISEIFRYVDNRRDEEEERDDS